MTEADHASTTSVPALRRVLDAEPALIRIEESVEILALIDDAARCGPADYARLFGPMIDHLRTDVRALRSALLPGGAP